MAEAPPEGPAAKTHAVPVPEASGGALHITAVLHYRKVDQFLLNFLLGEDSGVTSPVMEMARATASVEIVRQRSADPTTRPPRATGD
jgi:hypothetical protein